MEPENHWVVEKYRSLFRLHVNLLGCNYQYVSPCLTIQLYRLRPDAGMLSLFLAVLQAILPPLRRGKNDGCQTKHQPALTLVMFKGTAGATPKKLVLRLVYVGMDRHPTWLNMRLKPAGSIFGQFCKIPKSDSGTSARTLCFQHAIIACLGDPRACSCISTPP